MTSNQPGTVGELKCSGYEPRTVKDELRQNLITRLKGGEDIFPGIIGFDDTVVPMIVNAILARHDFILLGLRGQAKSRILRQLVDLLDPEIPILAGSEINDDPLKPISKYARLVLAEKGDDAPVAWVTRDNRFVEKLATPDVDHGRHHRGRGPHQGRTWRTHPRRRVDDPLRTSPPGQPRHLRDERAARSRGEDSGRPF